MDGYSFLQLHNVPERDANEASILAAFDTMATLEAVRTSMAMANTEIYSRLVEIPAARRSIETSRHCSSVSAKDCGSRNWAALMSRVWKRR
jgi:hypothetical protein